MPPHVDRAAHLKAWAAGFDPDVLPHWDMRDERITLAGDTALVTATHRRVRARDGRKAAGMTCYTDTYVRTGGRLLCLLAQLTAVAPENTPPDRTIVVRCLRGVRQ